MEEPVEEDAAMLKVGTPLAGGLVTAAAAKVPLRAGDGAAKGDVRTKVGFRAIAVIFKD